MSSPIIFEKGTRDFSTLGLGLLSDAIQATTTEELNGQFIFEMDYPVSGNNADLIKENRIIVVNSGHILKRQGFIIRQIVRKIDLTMTVYAEHVSYATLDVALAPVGTISGDAKTALENWKRMLVPAVDFTVDSDILTTNSTSIGAPEFETARQGLGGHVGSILDVWGGEYQFDNWHIRLLKQRGKSANAIIAYGRNLISFEQDTNIADTYTSVYPYYQENSGDDGNKTHFLPERTVDSEFVGKYPNPKVLMLELSNKFKDVADYSETKLRNYALSFIQSNNIGVPKVNMKISTVDLSRATGGFSEDIDLGDTVNVYFEKLGITTSAKVVKAVWNVLSDDYDKFEIGARRSSLTESISELATTADENANKALNQALVAQQSADGKTTIYYLDSSDPWPTNPKENDTAFVKDGENSIMYRYMFNNDTGVFSWVKILDSMSADQIKQRVSDALESGKAYSNQLVADNVAQVNAVLDDVQAKQADLTAQQAELDTKAQGYANKALADAKANTLATATQTAKDASDALAKAKTDLTTNLNKEVTDRANAVTALDTKAKGYADTAKNDAISASTTALNTAKTDLTTSITKEVTDRTKAVSDLDTKAQGYATQAKTDAIATANGAVTKEVTDRQKAVTDLDAKATGAINQAKTDAQSALDALQVGGRNLLLNSKTLWPVSSNGGTNAKEAFDSTTNMFHIMSPAGSGINKGIYFNVANNTSTAIPVGQPWAMGFDIKGTGVFKQVGIENSVIKGQTGNVPTDWTRVTVTGTRTTASNIVLYFDATTVALDVYIKLPKLEQGTKATDYTQAPEDIVLDYTTKDNVISQSLTQYQATNDGKVTKAQSDATQALGLVATKVSQTDYNTKTGDLDSKYTAVKQTADQASTDIVAIKSTNTSQDTKINTLTSDVSGTKQSISDIQTEQGKQSTKINTIQTDVSGTKQDISDIQDANGAQDGKIATISTTVDGLSSSFSTYKTTNDGKVAKAQADITANATAISQKVSQTAYDTKTGQLQTDLNTTTTTANQAKTDIVAIKKTNTDQDARMTTIESDANGVKTTVSSLQTTANTQAGSISTLKQRADGFDATVATLGQINQLFNTEFSPDFAGWVSGDSPLGKWDVSTAVSLNNDGGYSLGAGKHNGSNVLKKTFSGVGVTRSQFSSLPIPVGAGQAVVGSIQAQSTPSYDGNVTARIDFRYYDSAMNYISMDSVSSGKLLSWTTVQMARTTPANTAYIVYVLLTNGTTGNNYYSQPMLTFSDKVGQYVQGNYNNNASVAKAQLTADNASLALSNYKTDADGRISKAQSDITANASAITQKVAQTVYDAKVGDLTTKVSTAQQTADSVTTSLNSYKTTNDGKVAKAQADIIVNANAITQKVSQSDYNAKTGDLTTKVNTAQSTADSATSTIGAYKTSNDARVASAESKITANATAITSKVSQSDYNTKTGQIDGQISTINQTAGQISQSVSNVKAQVDGLSVGGRNLYLNTKALWMGGIGNNGSKVTLTLEAFDSTTNMWHLVAPQQAYANAGIYLGQSVIQTGDNWALSFDVKGTGNWSSNGARIENSTVTKSVEPLTTSWARVSSTGKKVSAGGATIFYFDLTNSPLDVYIKLPKLEYGNMPTSWSPAPEDTDNKISTVSQTVDGISSIVSDPTTGLTKRVQTAEGTLSQVTGADIPALQKATYWQPYGSLDLDTYKTQGSYYFNSTTAKPNGPTTSTDWMYMQVEVANSDKVTQIVWYDKTTSAKITYKRQYAGGTWSPWYANDNDSVATITQTNGAIKTEISDRQKGDTNTLTQAKDFTTSSISNSESGMRSLITQTSDSIIAKVDTKTDSATVLSLLKDNWSIGIADNAGALASGIAGDLNGMTLISKEITLDSNTTVTGDFYAKGGNFKNINASNITVGNLDADEVRIINLDVNTLTGDVSRFLETNWDGAYGSTKITSAGMKINTQYIQADFQGFGMDFSYSNKKIGGMGISQYLNGQPGLSMRLESGGAYMAWSARNEGDSTGQYIDKLAWYRQGKPALGGNYGFIFSDRVTFNKPINVEGASINLGFRPINLYGNLFPFFGNQDNITGFAFTSNEIYMVLQNQYVNLSKVIKALSGLGTWSVPTNIDSTGKVTQWRNVTT